MCDLIVHGSKPVSAMCFAQLSHLNSEFPVPHGSTVERNLVCCGLVFHSCLIGSTFEANSGWWANFCERWEQLKFKVSLNSLWLGCFNTNFVLMPWMKTRGEQEFQSECFHFECTHSLCNSKMLKPWKSDTALQKQLWNEENFKLNQHEIFSCLGQYSTCSFPSNFVFLLHCLPAPLFMRFSESWKVDLCTRNHCLAHTKHFCMQVLPQKTMCTTKKKVQAMRKAQTGELTAKHWDWSKSKLEHRSTGEVASSEMKINSGLKNLPIVSIALKTRNHFCWLCARSERWTAYQIGFANGRAPASRGWHVESKTENLSNLVH